MMGIYCIKNMVNGRKYIGSSNNIFSRWNEHIRNLTYKMHHSHKFQSDWNAYEITDFHFSILEIVSDKKNLLSVEQDWLDREEDFNNLYNVSGSTSYKSIVLTKEFIENIDYCVNISEETMDMLVENIRIYDKKNSLLGYGKEKYDLSKKWFVKNDKSKLANNITNYFRHIMKTGTKYTGWTTFSQFNYLLNDKGHSRAFIPINGELELESKRNVLCFAANCFPNAFIKRDHKELEFDDDLCALSILLKWIVNVSDITKPINIYIVSKRMEDLLRNWIESNRREIVEN